MSPLRRFFQIAAFVASIIMMCGMGTNYAFSTYAPSMKENLHFTQTELNMIPAIGGVIAYFTSLGIGSLHDWVGAPFVCFATGAIMFGGYFLMFLANEHVFTAPWYVISIFFALIATGQAGGYVSALSTNTKNFATKYKGKITGILLMAYGLSAGIVTQIYKSFFYPSVSRYFFFLSIFIPSITVPSVVFLRQLPKEKSDNLDEESSSSAVSSPADEQRPLLVPEKPATLYPEYSGLSLFKHLDFYLIGFVTLFGCGAGLMMINNIGSIAISWQIEEIEYPTYVIVMSLGNAFGRLIYGVAIDQFVKRFPASFLFGVCFICIAFAHGLMAFVQNYITLMIGTILNGLSYGGAFAVMPYVVNTYYGPERYGFHLMLINAFVHAAGFLFSEISGLLYDEFAQSSTPTGEPRCFGSWCWSITLAISTASSIIAIWIVVWLGIREKRHLARRDTQRSMKIIQ